MFCGIKRTVRQKQIKHIERYGAGKKKNAKKSENAIV
jgi:hypothetical protein